MILHLAREIPKEREKMPKYATPQVQGDRSSSPQPQCLNPVGGAHSFCQPITIDTRDMTMANPLELRDFQKKFMAGTTNHGSPKRVSIEPCMASMLAKVITRDFTLPKRL